MHMHILALAAEPLHQMCHFLHNLEQGMQKLFLMVLKLFDFAYLSLVSPSHSSSTHCHSPLSHDSEIINLRWKEKSERNP